MKFVISVINRIAKILIQIVVKLAVTFDWLIDK